MNSSSAHEREHVLACLSSAPSNPRIIRTAARMAKAFNGKFTTLFVETPDFAAATPENKQRLQTHRQLAERLGAENETVYGDDVPFQIAEFARLSHVTRIVLGRSAITRKHRLGKPTLTELLLNYAPEVDIHIIPDRAADAAYHPRISFKHRIADLSKDAPGDVAKSVGILCGSTMLCMLFQHLGFTDANLIMVYILGVLLTSTVTSHLIYSLVSSIASVFIFNFLFTAPRFTFAAYGTGYPITFVVMFLTAFITGSFATRYKKQAGQAARIAQRTRTLFDTNQLLSKARDKDEIFSVAAAQITRLLDRNIVLYEVEDGKLGRIRRYQAGSRPQPDDGTDERQVAQWVLDNNHLAGATTRMYSHARCMYLAIRVNERVYGVVGIYARKNPLDASEHSILLSILGECALALENEKNAREKEAAAVLAESEQLRANLLRAISHDLRTPLTSISGHASNLISNGSTFDEETRLQLYTDIYDDSVWLINLVENLLYATRIEEGRMTLKTSAELISEIVEEALRHHRLPGGGRISFSCEDELMIVRADPRLIVQVLLNLLDNAMKYAPAGTPIRITAAKAGEMAEISVEDEGPGIPDEDKAMIFEKFYCGSNRVADSRRSLGLGLYLCKAIINAHGGDIRVEDRTPHGSVFRFTLPTQEVSLHEQIPDSGR